MSFVEGESFRQLLRTKSLYSSSISTTILRLLLESTAGKQVKEEAADSMRYCTRFRSYCQRVKHKKGGGRKISNNEF
jgi:hypothetical protein